MEIGQLPTCEGRCGIVMPSAPCQCNSRLERVFDAFRSKTVAKSALEPLFHPFGLGFGQSKAGVSSFTTARGPRPSDLMCERGCPYYYKCKGHHVAWQLLHPQ